jgi:hypothetical protein
MIYPLIGAGLHGWLDDIVAATYLLGMFLLGLQGPARAAALAGAVVHFTLTRFTAYPQGTFKIIPFRVHAFIELGEGVGMLIVAACLSGTPIVARGFLVFMGLSQFAAFGFSDYRTPAAARASNV